MSLLASLVIVKSVNLASERGRQCSYPIAGAYLPVTGLDYSAASVEVLLFRQHIDRAGFAGSGLCRNPRAHGLLFHNHCVLDVNSSYLRGRVRWIAFLVLQLLPSFLVAVDELYPLHVAVLVHRRLVQQPLLFHNHCGLEADSLYPRGRVRWIVLLVLQLLPSFLLAVDGLYSLPVAVLVHRQLVHQPFVLDP